MKERVIRDGKEGERKNGTVEFSCLIPNNGRILFSHSNHSNGSGVLVMV